MNLFINYDRNETVGGGDVMVCEGCFLKSNSLKRVYYTLLFLVPLDLVLSISLNWKSTANGAVRVPVHTAAHEIAIERGQTGFSAI